MKLLIKNGTLVTARRERRGDLLVEDGRIAAVDACLEVPGAEVIDAAGCLVTPGFVDGHCHIGMMEETIGWAGNDTNEITDPITPQMRV